MIILAMLMDHLTIFIRKELSVFFCIKTDDVEGFGFESITSANNIPFKTLFEMGRDMKSLHIKRPENLFHFFL